MAAPTDPYITPAHWQALQSAGSGTGSFASVKDSAYAAKGDGVVVTASTHSNTTVDGIASASSAWVGRQITGPGIPAGATVATAVDGATSITISAPATATAAGVSVVIGSDDTAAINAAVAAVAPAGGTVYFPPGIYFVTATIVVPGGVLLLGSALDYSIVNGPAQRGSVVTTNRALASGCVQLGSDSTSSVSGQTGASAEWMIFDGAEKATCALRTAGRRNYVRNCQVWRGTTYALKGDGQNMYVTESVIGNNNVGSPLYLTNNDPKVINCQVRQGGVAQIEINGAVDVLIQGCHLFGGASGTIAGTTGDNVRISNAAAYYGMYAIVGNTFDGTMGHHINVIANANNQTRNLVVTGNVFFQVTGFPATTYDVVHLDASAAASAIRDVSIVGNAISNPYLTGDWRSFVWAVGTVGQVTVAGNSGANVAAILSGFRPDHNRANTFRTGAGGALLSDNSGQATFSGTGAQTAFVIPHGLGVAPNNVVVTPGSAAAAGTHYATADATNITVTFTAAPASGANNVVLNWRADS